MASLNKNDNIPGASDALDSNAFFRRDVLIYTHVEKTGGSSFVVGLRQIFGADRVYDIRGGHPRPVDMTPKDLGKMWVFSGHFWFDTQERPIGRRKHYFMSVRDPVDRFLSYYNYVAAAPSHPGYSKYGILDISDAFDYLKRENPNAVFNRFCAMYGARTPHREARRPGRPLHPRRPVSFEEAREKIEQNYALVVPMRRLDDAMAGIADAFGIDYTPIDHVNVATQKRAARVPDDVREQIIQGNSEDYRLIEFYSSVFEERLARLRSRLAAPPPVRPREATIEGRRTEARRPLIRLAGSLARPQS